MTGKTHMVGGLLLTETVLICSQPLGIETTPIIDICCVAGGLFGSILCDIDERHSFIGKILWPLSYLFFIIKILFRFLSVFFPKKSRIHRNLKTISFCAAHRGIMHWPLTTLLLLILNWGLVILTCLLLQINITPEPLFFTTGIFFGMASHLIYDFVSGYLALLAPFSMKKYGIVLVPSRGFLDVFIIRGLSILGCIVLYTKYLH